MEGTDGPEVTFNHLLTRDAVRDGIGTARRQYLHRRIGQILGATPASEPSVVAHHLMQGGHSVEGDAVAAMLRAGDAALADLARLLSAALDGLALDRARTLGRAGLLARALVGSRVALVGPEHAEARLARMEEVLALPADQRSHAATMGARMGQLEDHLLAGDRPGARAQLVAARHQVEVRGHPYWRWVVETWGAPGWRPQPSRRRSPWLASRRAELGVPPDR